MPAIAVVSPCGGSGRSSLAAALAHLAAREKLWSLAVECDSQNLLALHFGAARAPADGLFSHAARDRPWNTAALAAVDGTFILPFGAMEPRALVDWERRLVAEPDWLAARLDTLARPAGGWTFLDTARWPSVLARQGVRAADAALLVLRADGTGSELLDDTLARLEEKPLLAVVNGFDPGRALQADLLAGLQARLGARLCPHAVHRDEAVAEAFVRRTPISGHAPHSQVAHDLHGLFRWIQRQSLAMKEPQPGSNVV